MREFFYKFIASLILDKGKDGSKISLGRVSFIVLFLLAVYMWAPFLGGDTIEIPEGMLSFMMVLTGYVLGTKGIAVLQEYMKSKKSSSEIEE